MTQAQDAGAARSRTKKGLARRPAPLSVRPDAAATPREEARDRETGQERSPRASPHQRGSALLALPDELLGSIFERLCQPDAHSLYCASAAVARSPSVNACIRRVALADPCQLHCGEVLPTPRPQSLAGLPSPHLLGLAAGAPSPSSLAPWQLFDARSALASVPKRAAPRTLAVHSSCAPAFLAAVQQALPPPGTSMFSSVVRLEVTSHALDAHLMRCLAHLCPRVRALTAEGILMQGALSAAAVGWPLDDGLRELVLVLHYDPTTPFQHLPVAWPEVGRLTSLRRLEVACANSGAEAWDLRPCARLRRLQHLRLDLDPLLMLRGVRQLQRGCTALRSLELLSDFALPYPSAEHEEDDGTTAEEELWLHPRSVVWPSLESVRLASVTYGLLAQLRLHAAPALRAVAYPELSLFYRQEDARRECQHAAAAFASLAAVHSPPAHLLHCVVAGGLRGFAAALQPLGAHLLRLGLASDAPLEAGDGGALARSLPNVQELTLALYPAEQQEVNWSVAAELLLLLPRLHTLTLEGDDPVSMDEAGVLCAAAEARGASLRLQLPLPWSEREDFDELLLAHPKMSVRLDDGGEDDAEDAAPTFVWE